MKAAVIKASPRGDKAGSSRAADAFIRGLKSKDVSVTEIMLKDQRIRHCTGCYTCWTKTPGACVHRDSMDTLLPVIADSDLVVYATPLYTYSVPGILKDFFDRCLPLSQPYLVESGDSTGHPGRTEKERQTVVISTAGFPERDHFSGMMEMFKHLTGGGKGLAGSILIPGAEMLANDTSGTAYSEFYTAVEMAGSDIASDKKISEETEKRLRELEDNRLASTSQFRDIANAYWKSLQPDSETGTEFNSTRITPADGAAVCSLSKGGMESLMAGMACTFNPEAEPGMTGVFQFDFENECYHLIIQDNTCKAYRGNHPASLFTVYAPKRVWEAVCDGRMEGAEGLLTGKYTVDGDIASFMKMDRMFSSVEDNQAEDENSAPASPGILEKRSGGTQMTIAFLPWTLLWVLTPLWGHGESALLSAFLSVLLVVYRIFKRKIPFFESGTAVFMIINIILVLAAGPEYRPLSHMLEYMFLSGLWSVSLVRNHCLTAEYIAYDYPAAARRTPSFIETNRILTSAWSIYFLISALLSALSFMTDAGQVFTFIPYGMLLGMFLFTGWFQRWYPPRLMKIQKNTITA